MTDTQTKDSAQDTPAYLEEIPNVFQLFQGLDDAYTSLIREHQAIQADTSRTPEYKAESRRTALAAIRTLIKDCAGEARKEVEAICARHSLKAADPVEITPSHPVPENHSWRGPEVHLAKALNAQDVLLQKTLQEMERGNRLAVWNAQLTAADSAELETLFEQNRFDTDFLSLLRAEMKRRGDTPDMSILATKMQQDPNAGKFPELDRLNAALSLIASGKAFWPGLDRYTSLADMAGREPRNIEADLDSKALTLRRD